MESKNDYTPLNQYPYNKISITINNKEVYAGSVKGHIKFMFSNDDVSEGMGIPDFVLLTALKDYFDKAGIPNTAEHSSLISFDNSISG